MVVFILPALWWIRIRSLWSFLMGESWITILNGLPWKRTEIILSFLRLHQSQIDGWMASPTQRTWVWVDSTSWWWTGRPGVLWFVGSQRVGHNWAIELNWTDMNQPWVYMCSPSWTPLPSPSLFHPSGSSQSTSPEQPVSCIKPGLVIYFTYGNVHVPMLFSQIIPPSLSPTESQSMFFTSVSLLLSCI